MNPSSKPTFNQLPFKEFIPEGDEKVEDHRKRDLNEWLGEENNPNSMNPVQFWEAVIT